MKPGDFFWVRKTRKSRFGGRTLSCLAAATLVALGTATGSSRASVDVEGGSANQRGAISHVLQALPATCRTAPVLHVVILNDSDMDRFIADGEQPGDPEIGDMDSIDGIFQDNPMSITLRGSAATKAMSDTFAHEYGHYVWETMLSSGQRRAYESVYKRSAGAHRLVTDYAGTSVEEGFAEAFCYEVLHHAILQHRDPASSSYLDRILRVAQDPATSPDTAQPSELL